MAAVSVAPNFTIVTGRAANDLSRGIFPVSDDGTIDITD
jgi:hypothetical protein